MSVICTSAPADPKPHSGHTAALTMAALGVVYGDIGTSPLYALRECFHGHHGLAVTPDNVIGILSLIFWSLILIVSVKYIVFILRADSKGEGGILALTTLVTPARASVANGNRILIVLGLFGAALLYGDGIITPAISVLSAVEGLSVATPLFTPYLIPITIAILIGLFYIQQKGTAVVGALFGPVLILWFAVIGGLGVWHISKQPAVFAAINPWHAFTFFQSNGWHGFLALGAVFLTVTGGEALYADMGHFGRRPIRLAWFILVLPSLILNYFGQGSILLSDPSANYPFYQMAPGWTVYPLIVLATAATVIASQAMITGAYSISMQAIQLGYSPRMQIKHTSAAARGQIYMPVINWTLMIACIALVIGFRTSSNLAAAYGIAVTTTMVITTILFYFVTRDRWHWPRPLAVTLIGGFLLIDLAFFAANALKIIDGGWFPLVVAGFVFTLMTTWKTGRQVLANRIRKTLRPLQSLLKDVEKLYPVRVPGTAVFMAGNPAGVPPALLLNLKHNQILHERIVILSVETEEVSSVAVGDRVTVERLGLGFYRLKISYGFMETPNIPKVLSTVSIPGLEFRSQDTTYFLGRESLIVSEHPTMWGWRNRLFVWLSRNALSATSFFRLPAERVVELGSQVEL